MSVELPTAQEIAKIAGYAAVLPERVADWTLDWTTRIIVEPANPWLTFRFEPRPPYPTDAGIEPVELVLWRFSLAVFELDEHGATRDAPLEPQDFARRLPA